MDPLGISGMLATWIAKQKQEKDRDPMRLYLSDLGKCPRQIQYRLLQTPTNPASEQSIVNKELMFRQADNIETDITQMFAEGGHLWGFQESIEIPDRENWGGRYDIIADYPTKRIIEVKTLHPNAFRYDLDYPTHRLQAWSYHHYLAQTEELKEYPLLVYFDRGGSNTPVEQIVTPQPVVAVMDELDCARFECNVDQEVKWNQLPKVLKIRNAGKTIKLEPDGRCQYCDYSQLCAPDMGTEAWANRPDDVHPWVPTKKADPEALEAFATTIVEDSLD